MSEVGKLGKLGQNLQVDERVRITRTTCPHLDAAHGTIVGKSFDDGVMSSYIILLDVPHPTGWKAISLVESCIERLSNHD
jgi:hypothetical protein